MNRALCLVLLVLSSTAPLAAEKRKPAPPQGAKASATEDRGEIVFRANCSRCHQEPEQLGPRITGTVLLHMRVRASLSAADEKSLRHYLAP